MLGLDVDKQLETATTARATAAAIIATCMEPIHLTAEKKAKLIIKDQDLFSLKKYPRSLCSKIGSTDKVFQKDD